MAELNAGKLYDINKELMNNEKPLDPIMLNNAIIEVSRDMINNNFYMLLCHERRDYTIFHMTERAIPSKIGKELAETLCNRGYVLSIDKQPDGAYEIWIRDIDSKENFVYYLFSYDDGVVEVK